MTRFDTISEVQQAVISGKKVHWSNGNYVVICDMLGACLIAYRPWSKNPNYVGLFWQDGVTSDYNAADFYIAE